MSTGATLPLESIATGPVVGVASRSKHRRQLGALLIEAQLSDVASIDFLGGTAAVFSTRSPQKETPNEDVAAIWPMGPTSGVLAVADGLGGHAGGERASRLAIETIQKSLQEATASPPENGEPIDLRAAILNGIEAANQAVRELGTGAATTLALVEIQDRTIRTYHVGDSAILRHRPTRQSEAADDPPLADRLRRRGRPDGTGRGHPSRSPARHFERHRLRSNANRNGPAHRMAPRDTLLLASDGLFDNLLPDEIVEAIRSGPLDQLNRLACRSGPGRMATSGGTAPSSRMI